MTSPALQDIVVLLGFPAAGNPAQYLFERAINAARLDWRFLTVDVAPERLGKALGGIEAMGFRGCLLAGPLQECAVPILPRMSPAARFAAAASLVEVQADGAFGHMTEGRGIVEALRSHADLAGSRVLVAGAGVAGRAAALELSLAGVGSIRVADQDSAAAAGLVEALSALDTNVPVELLSCTDSIEVPEEVGIVIASREQGQPARRLTALRPDLVIADTDLGEASPVVIAAREAGCCVVDGIEIHVERTAIDFQCLTGTETDPEMLREALEEFLSA